MLKRVAIPLVLALLVLVSPSGLARAQTAPVWQPQIAVVWPQDGQGHQTSVGQSRAVNVSVWPTNRVGCAINPVARPDGTADFSLWMAKNNDPVERVNVSPKVVERTIGGVTFPSLEYDNIPADIADDPTARYTFVAGLGPEGSNIWVHAADARTDYPRPVVPTGYGAPLPAGIGSRIQIVWPHDAQGRYAPPDRATFVNVVVEFFQHGTLLSIDPQPDSPYFLEAAIGNDAPEQHSTLGEHVTYTINGQTYPRWVFDNVPVIPGQVYHFLAPVSFARGAAPVYPSIWTHAADARTILPSPKVPPACTP